MFNPLRRILGNKKSRNIFNVKVLPDKRSKQMCYVKEDEFKSRSGQDQSVFVWDQIYDKRKTCPECGLTKKQADKDFIRTGWVSHGKFSDEWKNEHYQKKGNWYPKK